MPANPSSAPSGPDVARQISELGEMVACPHDERTGGNDYLLCNQCGLTWDYRKWPNWSAGARNELAVVCTELAQSVARALADASREGEWQPIETAPKDTDVLVVADGMVLFGRCSTAWRGRWFLNGVVLHDYAVTHWMPLPTPPGLRQRAAQEAPK